MCDVRFSLQGRYASVLDLSAFGITNTSVTIHGAAFYAGKGIDEIRFICMDRKRIAKRLKEYLKDRNLRPGLDDLIILDMEPNYKDASGESINFSPGSLGRYECPSPEPYGKTMQDELIKAYIRRISVAREVFGKQWPTAKLGLFHVIVPDGKGRETDGFMQRMRGYRRAGELGMYDELDYLIPVLYHRFGPSDVPQSNGSFDIARLRNWVERSTLQALLETKTLTRRNGEAIPLAPILTFWVNNGRSLDDNQETLPELMALQLQILPADPAVKVILLWSGTETIEEMEETHYEPIDIPDFLVRVGAFPLPGCA